MSLKHAPTEKHRFKKCANPLCDNRTKRAKARFCSTLCFGKAVQSRQIDCSPAGTTRWSVKEDHILQELGKTKTGLEIFKLQLPELKTRSLKSIQQRLSRMGFRPKKSKQTAWTPYEERYLKINYMKKTVKTIAKKLGRSEQSVQGKITRLDLSRASRRSWLTTSEVATMFGVERHYIRSLIDQKFIHAKKFQIGSISGTYQITRENILDFLKRFPMKLKMQKFDQLLFLDFLLS